MSSEPAARDGFAARMAALYGAYFFFGGIQLPYLPAWLAAQGLDERDIGVVLAIPMLVRIGAVPIAGRLTDRWFDPRTVLILTAALSAAGYAGMGLATGFLATAVAYAVVSVVSSPVLPLAEAYGLRGLHMRGLAYGPVRLWGSIAFIVANLAGGELLAVLGATYLIFVLAAAMAVAAMVAFLLPRQNTGLIRNKPGAGPWGSPAFVAVAAGASLIQASHALMYGFGTLQWSHRGLDGLTIGLLWATGVVAEVLLFWVSGRLVGRIGALPLILLGGLGAVLRWTAMAFDPPTLALPFLQCLHGLSFAATHAGAMHVLAGLRQQNAATAQADFAALQAITLAAATALSGTLVESFGSYAYFAMAIIAAGGLLVVAHGRRAVRAPSA